MPKIIVDSPELRSKALAIKVYFCLTKGLKPFEIAQELQVDYNAALYQSKRILAKCEINCQI